jgi:hypothetical protein
MNTRLVFRFDLSEIISCIEIVNPPVLPVTGEVVYLEWPAYIYNKKELSFLEEITSDHCFIAETLQKTYSPDAVEVLVLLHLDINFEKLQKKEKEESSSFYRSHFLYS